MLKSTKVIIEGDRNTLLDAKERLIEETNICQKHSLAECQPLQGLKEEGLFKWYIEQLNET